MVSLTLPLTGVWELGKEIGRGGAGVVYRATSEHPPADYDRYVIKLIPKKGASAREADIGFHLRDRPNIVPVLDWGIVITSVIEFGQTVEKKYFALLMPEAEYNLHKFVSDQGDPAIHPSLALPILIHIADGLAGLTGVNIPGHEQKEVVNRDLKPENILRLQDEWCISDFGIARYLDETTATETQRYQMTREYAAPEQWQGQSATAKTDVYAFGIIAYELLTGTLPFNGPDFQEQHTRDNVPPMQNVAPSLASVVHQCLYKQPGSRPSPTALVDLLWRQLAPGQSKPSGIEVLHSAVLTDIARRDQAARERRRSADARRVRGGLIKAALSEWEQIGGPLKQVILEDIPPCKQVELKHGGGWQLRLNSGVLTFSGPEVANFDTGSDMPFDVIAYGYITVNDRVHCLWYCDSQVAGEYLWYEVAFTLAARQSDASGDGRPRLALGAPSVKRIPHVKVVPDKSFSTRYEVAWPFTTVRPGDLDEFINRWITWFGDVARGVRSRESFVSRRGPGRGWREPPPIPKPQPQSHSSILTRGPRRRRRPTLYRGFRRVGRRPAVRLSVWAIVAVLAAIFALILGHQTMAWTQDFNNDDPSRPWKWLATVGLWVLVGVSVWRIWQLIKRRD